MKSALKIELDGVELLESYPKCKEENRECRLATFLPEVQRAQFRKLPRSFALGFDRIKEVIGDLELMVS
jgi:hypothetical protein